MAELVKLIAALQKKATETEKDFFEYVKKGAKKYDVNLSGKRTSGGAVLEIIKHLLKSISAETLAHGDYSYIEPLKKYVQTRITNNNSAAQYMSKINNLFRDQYGKGTTPHLVMQKRLQLDAERRNERVLSAARTVDAQNTAPIDIDTKNLEAFVRDLYEKSTKDVSAAAKYNKLIVAAICSGARKIELLNKDVSEFKIAPKKKEFEFGSDVDVWQHGRAKDRAAMKNAASADEVVSKDIIHKPVIFIKNSELKSLINEIRDDFAGSIDAKNNAEITNTVNKQLNLRLRKLFTGKEDIVDFKGAITFHKLRKIYARVSYEQYAGKSADLKEWITRVLGHSGAGTTAAHYTGTKSKEFTSMNNKIMHFAELMFKHITADNGGKLDDELMQYYGLEEPVRRLLDAYANME